MAGGGGGGKFDGRTFGAYRKVLRYMCTHPQYAVHPCYPRIPIRIRDPSRALNNSTEVLYDFCISEFLIRV